MSALEGHDNKLVSIIIPAYNVGNYIGECLKSISAQSYTNIQVIVIDDGSTDNTWQNIEDAMTQDIRIQGFHRENSGVSATRNFGIQQAKGEYIYFVDGDDYIAPDAVDTLVSTLESNNVDWVNCQYNRVDDDGNHLEEYSFKLGHFETFTEEDRFELILNPLIDYRFGYEVWDKLYKASIIRDKKISFAEDCRIGEDLAFNICYAFYAKGISSIEERPYYYRVRNNSAMGTVTDIDKNLKEHLAFVKGIHPYFEDAFKGQKSNKFYQLFFKLMAHASQGYTAKETAEAAKKLDDGFYKKWLAESLEHKAEFADFISYDNAKLYYRYGLYIKSKIEGDFIGEIYLKIYDFYRRLRKRPTIGEWRMQ